MPQRTINPSSMSYLFTVSGPSGVGKTTLCKKLPLEITGLKLSISCTSRPARTEEQEGKDYYFLTEEAFKKKIQNHDFIEWTHVHSHYYGTDKKILNHALEEGISILLNIDSVGAKNIKKIFQKKVFSFFIEPPDIETLQKRLQQRKTESQEAIAQRIQHGLLELKEAHSFDYRIVNQNYTVAYQQMKQQIIQLLSPH